MFVAIALAFLLGLVPSAAIWYYHIEIIRFMKFDAKEALRLQAEESHRSGYSKGMADAEKILEKKPQIDDITRVIPTSV